MAKNRTLDDVTAPEVALIVKPAGGEEREYRMVALTPQFESVATAVKSTVPAGSPSTVVTVNDEDANIGATSLRLQKSTSIF